MAVRPSNTGSGDRSWVFVATVVIVTIAQMFVGFFYSTSGLVVPGPAILMLWAWWLVLTVVGVLLVIRKSYWMILVPVVAAATWLGVLWFGQTVLGWTP